MSAVVPPPAMLALVATVAFGMGLLFTAQLLRPNSRLYVVDLPNERSLHDVPKPRTGGIGLLGGALLGSLLAALFFGFSLRALGLALLAAGIAVVGYLDDRGGIPVWTRFAAHTLAAVAALVLFGGIERLQLPGGLSVSLGWVGMPITVLFIVWMVNLYNFMDGMDGFAGGMSVSGFGAMAVMYWLSGATGWAGALLAIAAGAAAFLVFNFPPSRIFLGDVGSTTLGFLAASFSIAADHNGKWPLWVSVLLFSPFVADATVTLCKRLLRRERVWKAHRAHYYQRLVTAGYGHRWVVLREYVLMIIAAASAVLAASGRLSSGATAALAIAWVLAYTALMVLVDRRAGQRGST